MVNTSYSLKGFARASSEGVEVAKEKASVSPPAFSRTLDISMEIIAFVVALVATITWARLLIRD
jgi:hypothetical protein